MKQAWKAAIPVTIPVMTGYLFMGFAFGVLLRQAGGGPSLAAGLSVIVYAGSLQYLAVSLLSSGAGLLSIFLLSLLVNARHVFYGLPFLEKFDAMGRKKPYMIFSLTDETFSLFCLAKAPLGVDENAFMFFIALMDQCYWVAGSMAGVLVGAALPFSTKGIEFAMTALFVVIFTDQWRGAPTRLPALTGIAASVAALLIFGQGSFLLPAMAAIAAALMLMRKPIDSAYDRTTQGKAAKPCATQDMQ